MHDEALVMPDADSIQSISRPPARPPKMSLLDRSLPSHLTETAAQLLLEETGAPT